MLVEYAVNMSRSLKITLLAAVWLISQVSPLLGCINAPASPAKVGQPIHTEKLEPRAYIHELLSGHLTSQDWEFALAEAENPQFKETNSIDENGMAVALIHLGRTKEALKILEKLERKTPRSYYVAANLGTAYELVGDHEKAYKWIAEGMKRNPDSHFGTEWLHLKILKAKQAIKKDPKWIETNSVLGIDWKSIGDDLSKVQVGGDRGETYDAETVRKAIEYQLHERTEFVKPPDPTVASLLYDLSHLVRHSRSREHGDLVLNAAHTYGYPGSSTPSPALSAPAAETMQDDPTTSRWLPLGIIASVIAVLALAGLWLWKRHARSLR